MKKEIMTTSSLLIGMLFLANSSSGIGGDNIDFLKTCAELKHKYAIEQMEQQKYYNYYSLTSNDYLSTNIAKYDSQVSRMKEITEDETIVFMSAMQNFADEQVELEPTFQKALNRFGEITGTLMPSRKRF